MLCVRNSKCILTFWAYRWHSSYFRINSSHQLLEWFFFFSPEIYRNMFTTWWSCIIVNGIKSHLFTMFFSVDITSKTIKSILVISFSILLLSMAFFVTIILLSEWCVGIHSILKTQAVQQETLVFESSYLSSSAWGF